jgi:predicted phage terminase large subunit-like protein
MSKSFEWLANTGAKFNTDTRTWTFPSGATLSFGFLDTANDRYRYQSSEFQLIGFDECSQFSETDYLYLFSRLRRRSDSPVPLRMRAASNPGGVGHRWVKDRWQLKGKADQPISVPEAGRLFIPARLEDNPHLDREQYTRSLEQLDPFTRRQLLRGDWSEFAGSHFFPESWPRYKWQSDTLILPPRRLIPSDQVWKFAVCDPSTSPTGDATAVLVGGIAPGRLLLILDVLCKRMDVSEVIPTLARVCRTHAPLAFLGLESVAFQKLLVREASLHPDIPPVRELKPKGQGKLARAVPAIVKCDRGEVYLPESAPWLDDFVTEVTAFTGLPGGADDQTDCLAYSILATMIYSGGSYPLPSILIPAPGSRYSEPVPTHRQMGALGHGSELDPRRGAWLDIHQDDIDWLQGWQPRG